MQKEKLFTRNFVLTSLSTIAVFVSFYFLLVPLPVYIMKIGGSKSDIGFIIGVFTISAVLLRPFIGREIDVRGRKNVLIAGLIVFLLSMLLYNYTTDVRSLLILRAVHGIGWGAATTASATLIADIAPQSRRGEAMGVYGMSANFAMAIGPVLSVLLLYSSDFQMLFLVCSAIALVSLLLVLPISETKVVRPKTSLFSKEAFFPASLMFIVTLTYGSIVSFLPVFTQEQNIGPGMFLTGFAAKYNLPYSGTDLTAAIFLSVFAVTVLLIRTLAGKISDIKGRKFVIVPGMAVIISGLWTLSYAGSLSSFLIAAFLYGMGFGLLHPALMALLVDLVSEKGRAAAMSTFTAAFDLGIGTGSIVLGIISQSFSLSFMYFLSGLIVLAGMVWFMNKAEKKGI
ncbi:MAG: MFS transporter [Candidatus Methanoperedens sp.]|nr:MFS transporter [Candidatus Methanoperedens sp.]MCZ7360618.1 MFS transporter [Candidatus Methanoperedens sp.]HLB71963.1 MFS transporter [Candidatus Methanoperedens sp.]